MTFQQKLDIAVKKNNSLLCIGLDPVMEKLPEQFLHLVHPFFAFNKTIIDTTYDLVCSYKPNSAFYEAYGAKGIEELKKTCDYIRTTYPEIPIILDAKRGDIGSTNEGYVSYAFDYLQVDAITLNPYLGKEAIKPFLQKKEKGCIILCKTSNPGAKEFQNVKIGDEPLYKKIAKKIIADWNTNSNCLLVIGATYPKELAEIRSLTQTMTFLVPGVGTQGGDVKKTIRAGLNEKKSGMIINASRAIIFSGKGKNFAKIVRQKTLELQKSINMYRV